MSGSFVSSQAPTGLTIGGSANGTFLNGQEVQSGTIWPLQDGDRLAFGDVVLVFRKQGLGPPA